MLLFLSAFILLSSSHIQNGLQSSFSYGTILFLENPLLCALALVASSILSTYLLTRWSIIRGEENKAESTNSSCLLESAVANSNHQKKNPQQKKTKTQQKTKPNNIGILALEVYFPHCFVNQSDLERFDGVSAGKYTKGLGQTNMAFVTHDQDITSVATNAVSQLLRKYNVSPDEIGRLEIGTETLTDKSKSLKTSLMALFPNNVNLEGVTNLNACYGGTAALLNSIAWMESSDWNGKFALVVAADVAVYAVGPARPTGGVGAVAILIGPNAPLRYELGTRASYASHVWDFYKPDITSEYPTVDGAHSQTCYLTALDGCYTAFCRNQEDDTVTGDNDIASSNSSSKFALDTHVDFALFHSPYNKLVQKSFGRLLYNEFLRRGRFAHELAAWTGITREKSYTDRALDVACRTAGADLYRRMVQPSVTLSQQIGNSYTASLFCNLASLVDNVGIGLAAKRLLCFSYGSGAMASMYCFHGVDVAADNVNDTRHPRFSLQKMQRALNLTPRLAARVRYTPEAYTTVMAERETWHGRKNYAPQVHVPLGTWYLAAVDDMYQRRYRIRDDTTCLTSSSYPTAATTNATTVSSSSSSTTTRRGPSLLITGISAGLPGQDTVFSPNNMEKLLTGVNCLTSVSSHAKAQMLRKNIRQLQKRVGGNSGEANVVHQIRHEAQGIQLAGQLGRFDLEREFGIPKALANCMDAGSQLAVAAGLQAMQMAGLVSGKLENGWGNWRLDESCRDSTGVIFATSFPALDAMVSEVASYYHTNNNPDNTYAFDRKFLFKTLVLANAQLAQITGARGPNTQINAACASTTQAIGLARDWLLLKRCDRVIVISGDVASGEHLMEWIGSGFRALGAASIKSDVAQAARPFDNERNGMLLSSGAVALVVEADTSYTTRCPPGASIVPCPQLLATQYSNSAYHGASLDKEHMASELGRFLNQIETELGYSRAYLATHATYFSHETGTNASPTTSCAYAELFMLKSVFQEHFPKLLIANTKGFTGHPMGVSFEDVAAIASLTEGLVPPIVHFKTSDDNLNTPSLVDQLPLQGPLQIQKKFALRFAAGFGSQLAMTLYGLQDK